MRARVVIQCLFHLCSHGALVYSQKCLEEKNEILQGKLSQLEEHLARLRENPPREKGEVLGDVLQVGMHKSGAETCVLGWCGPMFATFGFLAILSFRKGCGDVRSHADPHLSLYLISWKP